MAYHVQLSIESSLDRARAWNFWSNVTNWAKVDPGIQSVDLDGPFTSGTRGVTRISESAALHWQLAEVETGQKTVIEAFLPGAVVRFHWNFEEAPGDKVRITQRVSLAGERVEDYLQGLKELEQQLPAGMKRLVQAMESETKS
jgi:hypothetical protein